MKKNPAAVALGRLGGSVTSEAKARAARKNGKKGGRPKEQKEDREDVKAIRAAKKERGRKRWRKVKQALGL